MTTGKVIVGLRDPSLRLLTFVAAVLLALGALTRSAPPAIAIANDVNGNCLHSVGNITYKLADRNPTDGLAWSPARANAVAQAAAELASVRGFLGSALVTFTRVYGQTPADFDMYYEMISGGAFGRTDCNTPLRYIAISPVVASPYDRFKGVVRHEMGHAAGLLHTGLQDNIHNPGVLSSMNTCYTPFEQFAVSLDDRAYLGLSRPQLGGRSFIANGGFESGAAFFRPTTGSSILWGNSGGNLAPSYLRYYGGPSEFLYQGINYNDAPGQSFRGAIVVKDGINGDNGNAALQVVYRVVNYSAYNPAENDCRFPNGKDTNDRTFVGLWQSGSGVTIFAPGSTWTLRETPTWTTPVPNQDLQLRIYDSTTGSGYIRLDEVRIRCFSAQPEGDCI